MSDIEKIEKLVRMTQSDNDHEALLALRNAQRLANGDLLSVLQGRTERGRRFLELLRRIRMKDATIEQLRREIERLKAKH
jgi:hypothetical protein